MLSYPILAKSMNINKGKAMEVKDANGTILADGDTVVLIKDLPVKGTSTKLKRGTSVKKIRLTSNADEIDCKIGGSQIVLKTCFVKKA